MSVAWKRASCVVALWDYHAETKDELSLVAGDILYLQEDSSDSPWILLKKSNDATLGYVPISYLKLAAAVPPKPRSLTQPATPDPIQASPTIPTFENNRRSSLTDQISYSSPSSQREYSPEPSLNQNQTVQPKTVIRQSVPPKKKFPTAAPPAKKFPSAAPPVAQRTNNDTPPPQDHTSSPVSTPPPKTAITRTTTPTLSKLPISSTPSVSKVPLSLISPRRATATAMSSAPAFPVSTLSASSQISTSDLSAPSFSSSSHISQTPIVSFDSLPQSSPRPNPKPNFSGQTDSQLQPPSNTMQPRSHIPQNTRPKPRIVQSEIGQTVFSPSISQTSFPVDDLATETSDSADVCTDSILADKQKIFHNLASWLADRPNIEEVAKYTGGVHVLTYGTLKPRSKETPCVFGMPLEEVYVEGDGNTIPIVIIQCVNYLMSFDALRVIGIFRISGNMQKMLAIKDAYRTPKSKVCLIIKD
jgi:hypothetical protein